jgi:hypothetical protein
MRFLPHLVAGTFMVSLFFLAPSVAEAAPVAQAAPLVHSNWWFC